MTQIMSTEKNKGGRPKDPHSVRETKGVLKRNTRGKGQLTIEEATLDEELSDVERMDLTDLEKVSSIAGKYAHLKLKYGEGIANEFRLRVLNSFVVKRVPNTVIAMAFNISLMTVSNLRKKLISHISKQVSRVSYNYQLGESLILKDQMRADALKGLDRVSKMEGLPEWDKERLRSHLRMEVQAHDNHKWHLMSSQIGDAKRYEPDYEGYKPLDDANEMKAILDAIVSGDDNLIKELTTGTGEASKVSDDFVIE